MSSRHRRRLSLLNPLSGSLAVMTNSPRLRRWRRVKKYNLLVTRGSGGAPHNKKLRHGGLGGEPHTHISPQGAGVLRNIFPLPPPFLKGNDRPRDLIARPPRDDFAPPSTTTPRRERLQAASTDERRPFKCPPLPPNYGTYSHKMARSSARRDGDDVRLRRLEKTTSDIGAATEPLRSMGKWGGG